MTILDFVALFCLVMMVVISVFVFVYLGSLPGRIAKKRGHPNAKAVLLGGWATLILALVGWPFVLMWAMSGQFQEEDHIQETESKSTDDLERQVRKLGQRMAAIESRLKQAEG
jgi:uncharacterized protein HemX